MKKSMKRKVVEGLLGASILMVILTGCSKADGTTQNAKAKENGITRELPPEDQIAPEDVIEKPSAKAIEGISDAEDGFRFHVQNAYYNIYLEEKEKLENGPMTEKGDEYAAASGQSWSYVYTAFENRGVSGDELDKLILATGINELPLQETMPKVLALWQDLDMDSQENTNVIGVTKTDSEYTAYEINKAAEKSR
ncbi:MAG: hypothetical protein EOM53_01240 [Alphaproteobacteria bacterium]|nr:hypothetical protein [Alphaproteobacteria bacterium]